MQSSDYDKSIEEAEETLRFILKFSSTDLGSEFQCIKPRDARRKLKRVLRRLQLLYARQTLADWRNHPCFGKTYISKLKLSPTLRREQ